MNDQDYYEPECFKLLGLKRSLDRVISSKPKKLKANLNCKFKLKPRKRNPRPKAPHNTNQFLTAQENVKCFTPQEIDYANYDTDIEDICITGGTMKGIFSLINTIDCRLENSELPEENTVDTEMTCEDYAYIFHVD
jgi:hypothetical protein